ncbi:microtubule-associated protein 9 isoform X2 [Sphaerodactylus townsendi]|uniref:microtubule-associated protein 9 isoform X2 n=1 Tax=Sphaerodactylus townsendi TaxID=933632 RepID=UPI0020273C43|nr:microtubule-associated protein 9 isoform X2 [Sphaerodactylus townsendi]
MSDEDIITTLAYSKSPKFSKRTTFQEELQEALFARAARQNSAEYLDDFETYEEGSGEELPADVECPPKKSVAFAIPLSRYHLGHVGTWQGGSAGDLDSSYSCEGAQPVSVSDSEILTAERQVVPSSLTENSGSYINSAMKTSVSFEMSPPLKYSWKRKTVDDLTSFEDKERTQATGLLQRGKGSEKRQRHDSELSASEEELDVEGDHDHQKKAPVTELPLERNVIIPHKPKIKPVPKPREFKTKAASASAENISIPAQDDYSKPSSQPRRMLRKSSHLEDYEGSKIEDRASYGHRSLSLSPPSSLTRLNDQVTKSEHRALSESPGPEGPWITSSSAPFPIHFSSLDERTGDSKLIMSEEEASKDQDQKETDNCSDLKLQNSGRESPSVIELMMTTVYEKTKKRNKSSDANLEDKLQTSQCYATEGSSDETAKEDKSEQKKAPSTSKVALSVSKDSVKEEVEEKETASQKTKPPAGRSLSATYLKKTGKPSHIPISTSSQYLGTLKVLDNKHLQKYSAELDKADSLRAAVYQDWLEKKRIFLLELQRIKRNKAKDLWDKNEKKQAAKKEEATASFEAWKTMKEQEAKKLAEKKRLEEEKKKKEAEENEKKKEEAQKAAFEKWKEKKAEYLKQQTKREKRVERLKKKKEEELDAEKKKDSRSAVEKWNEKKEEFMKQKKKEKIQERKKEVEEQFEKEEQDKKAIEEYEKWLEKKELKERIQKKQKKLQVILEDELPPPWSPPGKAVSSRSY